MTNYNSANTNSANTNDKLSFHPLATLFPVLEGDEAKQLQDDIEVRGLQFPIVLYQGQILDGRNRHNACVALGIEPITVQYQGSDPEGYVLSANLHRRHLSGKQRRELIATMVQRHPDRTSKKIAGELGVSTTTVEKVRKQVVQIGQPDQAGQFDQPGMRKRTGVDGKEYTFKPRKPRSNAKVQSDEPTKSRPVLTLTDEEVGGEMVAEQGVRVAEWVAHYHLRRNFTGNDWKRILEHVRRPKQNSEGFPFDDDEPATPPTSAATPPEPVSCEASGCEKPALTQGWCRDHWQRWYITGRKPD